MTDAPDTIDHEGHRYVRWDIMSGIIARSISQVITETLTFHPKYSESAVLAPEGWTDAEKAEVVAHAEG